MDGVLINSNPVHGEVWEIFCGRYGLKLSDALRQRLYGRRNDEIVRELFGPELSSADVLEKGAAKELLYREAISERVEEMLVPGLKPFLERYRHVPMAVATNAEPANLEFLLDRAGLRGYFRAAVDGYQVLYPKPHPDIYLRAAELLEVAPANCIVLEDSHHGIQAARAAGTRVIGVSTTYGDLPGAALTIDNFLNRNLEPWLQAQRAI